MQIIGSLLFAIHIFLLLWSVGGFAEMVVPKVPWKPFTNPEFPVWVLLIHWGAVLFALISFIYGYLTYWTKTPQIMLIAYGLMAIVCVIETFGFMTSKTKYIAMTAEYVAYVVILLLLFKNNYFINYFK